MTCWDCFSPFVRRLKLSCIILLHNQLDAFGSHPYDGLAPVARPCHPMLTLQHQRRIWRPWVQSCLFAWWPNGEDVLGERCEWIAEEKDGAQTSRKWPKMCSEIVYRVCYIYILNTYVTVVGTLRRQVNIGQCTPARWQEFWLIICRGHTHRPPGANLVLPASWLETQWYGGFHQWGYPKMNCL